MSNFKVTEKAMRAGSDEKQCFYCQEPIGGLHKDDCVLVKKKILSKVTIVFEDEMPADWNKVGIEFKYNDSSSCMDNFIGHILNAVDKCGCFCTYSLGEEVCYDGDPVKFEYIKDLSGPYLDEK